MEAEIIEGFNTFFYVFTHVLIVISILSVVIMIFNLMFSVDSGIENTIRASAFTTGFLIYYGSKSVGLTIPSLILESLTITNPMSLGLFGILFPSLTGVIVAWYFLTKINKNDYVATRLIIIIITFLIVMFSDVYITTFGVSKESVEGVDITLLPNLVFTIALSLSFILRYKHKENQ